ncbi:MAG TPA: DUF6328 family protein [Steroidobacteraceae bacterium]|nr:DUF6328 family protein [Steroidobacteraceae bacterium]
MGANLNSLLKISLDELRMQMLGAQVAFGFQFQSVFQERFDVSDPARRAVALAGLIFMVLTLGLLIAGPAVHRIADAGEASIRTQRLTASLAHVALITLAIGITAAVFVAVVTAFGLRAGSIAAALTAGVTLFAWHVWGRLMRPGTRQPIVNKATHGTSVHDRIDYMLTEARVMLPGAQALFGFQLLVPLMKSFETLPVAAQTVHFAALALVAMAVVLLIAPAAIHRIAFEGTDDPRFLRLASRFVTAALVPLALGIASELYVAGARLLPDSPAVAWTALGAACVLIGFWYVLPLGLRAAGGTE